MPETAAMPSVAASSPRNDRSYSVAVALILVFAAVEILATAIHFGAQYQRQRAAARAQAAAIAASRATPAPAAPATPPPARSIASPSPTVLSVSERLLKEATDLRERGDTANALARLQEAAQRDPSNANVLAELATIYESIQLFDRSNETWQKIQALGPAAGPLYDLAQSRLRNGVPAASAPPAIAPLAAADAVGKTIDGEGIPEGSIFGITDVTTEPVADPDAETNLRLKIAVRKRPGVSYEVGKLRINVFLYDLADGKVVLTDADTSSEWLSPKHDWSDTDAETLIVSYRRSKTHAVTSEAALSAAAAAVTPGKASSHSKKRAEPSPNPETQSNESNRRSYLGYLIRVYYNDKLQTVRADPARLVNDAPPASP
jgi:tetratricopeptide (TPR) repeat protein